MNWDELKAHLHRLGESARQNAFELGAAAYGLYSAGKGLKNLREGQGCAKCETTGVALGLVLASWALLVMYEKGVN